VHDEGIILDERTKDYLGLNASGAVIWFVLADGGSDADAVAELMNRFEVTRETAEADVAAFLTDLLRREMIAATAR